MDPFLLAVLGIVSLFLAYIITSKESVENGGPHSPDSRNIFSASGATRVEGNAFVSEYTPPHPPHDNVGAVPSMTRVFNNLLLIEKDRRTPTSTQNTLKIDSLKGSSSLSAVALKQVRQADFPDEESPTRAERGGDTYRAMSAPLESPPPSVSSFLRVHNTSRACTPAPNLAPTAPVSSSSNAPRSILSRSRSTLHAASPEPGARSMSVPVSRAPVASSPLKSPKARNLAVSKRHTRKCARNPKFLNILPNGERPATAYFMTSDRKPVDEPPMEELLKKLPPLHVGDLYCHKTPSVTLIWIYLEDKDKMERFWERIDVGYVCELDGRMLSLTASGKPNFVGDEWANKRQNTEEKRRKKGKGKQVEEAGDDESDELESEDD